MNRSETIGKVIGALLRAQKNMGNVTKDSKNPFFKSNYADINALRAEAMPALNAEGLVLLQPPTTYEGRNYIETIIAHEESGEFLSSLNEVVTSKQNDPQNYLAAQTYTRRGALQAFLSMGSEDDDGNTANGRTTKEEKPSTVTRKDKTKDEVKAAQEPNLEVNEPKEPQSQPEPEVNTRPAGGSFRRRGARG